MIPKSGSNTFNSYSFSDQEENRRLWDNFLKWNELVYSAIYKKIVNSLFNYGMHLHPNRELNKELIQKLFSVIWQNRNSLVLVDVGSTISPEAISGNMQANPLNPSPALEQINNQHWVVSFLNRPEAFANFRRSGFPTLEVNPFLGRDVPFVNRLTYLNSEISVNSENVQAAISAQGADNLATKVWFDK